MHCRWILYNPSSEGSLCSEVIASGASLKIMVGKFPWTECIWDLPSPCLLYWGTFWTLIKGRVTTWDDVTGKWWDPAHVCTQPGPACAVWCVCGISFLSPATCSSEHTSANIHVVNLQSRKSRWSWIWRLTYVNRTELLCDGRRKCLTFNLLSYHIHRSCTCLLESHFRDSENQYLSLSFLKGGVYYILFFSFSTE